MSLEKNYTVTALYKFVSLPNFKDLQQPILDFCNSKGIKGSLLLAHEGINGTVAGADEAIQALHGFLKSIPEFNDLDHKESYASEMPFMRMKVKLKKEIVTMGIPSTDPTNIVGTYVDPKDWNAIISDPETIVVDTRNDYEYAIGTFKNALDPNTKSFREFPDYVLNNLDKTKHKNVAMFCTGGIRCEKSTSYLKTLGFENVYHLKGGILKYLEQVPEEESLWEGECFVFDNRVAVKHGLEEGVHELCHGCRLPISPEDMASSKYKPGVHCPHCYDTQTPEQRSRAEMRQKQIDLAKKRGEKHLGCACSL